MGFDQYLYRDNPTPSTAAQKDNTPAMSLEPGSIIQSCTWQTSPGNDRVELTPNDKETVYRDNIEHIQLDRDGLTFFENPAEYTVDTYSDPTRNDLIITRDIVDDFVAIGEEDYWGVPEKRVAVYKTIYYQPDQQSSPCPQPVFLGYGYVDSGGFPGGVFQPFDWISSNVSTGIYKIEHSIGNTSYLVFVTPSSNLAKVFSVQNPTSTSFEIRFGDVSGSLIDTDFYFQVMTQPI